MNIKFLVCFLYYYIGNLLSNIMDRMHKMSVGILPAGRNSSLSKSSKYDLDLFLKVLPYTGDSA